MSLILGGNPSQGGGTSTIDGVTYNGSKSIVHSGKCTPGSTKNLTVACSGFNLVEGAEITVLMSGHCLVDYPTLNVNNTGAKSITYMGEPVASGALLDNCVYRFYYDGTQYRLLSGNSIQQALNAVYTDSKRYIYRHPNNCGSVIVFDNFGTTQKLFVADAKYRTEAKWGAFGIDAAMPKISVTDINNKYCVDSSLKASDTSVSAVTDRELQSNFWALEEDQTARENCDVWITYNSQTDSQGTVGVPAVAYARSLDIPQIANGCDIPTLYQLSVIFIEFALLDSLDPTIESYPENAFSKTDTSNRWIISGNPASWGCTEGINTANGALITYQLRNTSIVEASGRQNQMAVIPIREL